MFPRPIAPAAPARRSSRARRRSRCSARRCATAAASFLACVIATVGARRARSSSRVKPQMRYCGRSARPRSSLRTSPVSYSRMDVMAETNFSRRVSAGSQRRQVIDGRGGAGDPLVVLRAGHPAIRQRLGGRLHLVGGQRLQQGAPPPQNADVRAEELVRRAGQEVAIPRLHVDGAVRRVMHGVEVDQRPRRVRLPGEGGHVRHAPHGVAGAGQRRQTDPAVQFAGQVVPIERAVLGPNVHEADLGPGVPRRQHPRADVGVVVQTRDDHHVAGLQRAGDRPADVQRQRRHVLAEDDLLRRRGVDEVGEGLVGAVQDGVGFATGGEEAAVVRIAVAQVVGDGVDHPARDLRAPRAVEEDRRSAVDDAVQGRELLPDGGKVEHDGLSFGGWVELPRKRIARRAPGGIKSRLPFSASQRGEDATPAAPGNGLPVRACESGWTGNPIVKQAPPSRRLAAVSVPPWAWTTRRQMLSPRPVPVGLVLAKGVNSRSATAAAMPGPVSATLSSHGPAAPGGQRRVSDNRPPWGITSSALRSRFTSTPVSWSSSPSMHTAASGASTSVCTPC